jgi:hypothetical protein
LPGEGGGQESIVISDINLNQVARRGRISVGGNLDSSPEVEEVSLPEGVPVGQPTPEEKWQRDYEAQVERMRRVENEVSDYERRKTTRTSPYDSYNAHARLPGTADPRQVESERARRALERERTRLQQMRREARRRGYDTPR